jgi:glycosyltransferase involved in cell wall biosynthesis
VTPRIALIMPVVSDLGGSGGAERLFSHLHEFLTTRCDAEVTLVTSAASLRLLQAAGRLTIPTRVLALDLGAHPGRGRAGVMRMTARLLGATFRERFDVAHVCLPSPIYAPFAAVLTRLPGVRRTKVTITVIDCTLANSLESPPPVGTYERQVLDAHTMYRKWARIDGTYAWYRAYVDAVARGANHTGGLLRAARFCFTEPDRFTPAPVKDRVVVFAGRLSEQKRPLLFVDAVAALRRRHAGLIEGWRFEIYGRGVLQEQVDARIADRGLTDIVRCTHAIDLAPIFSRSRLFVSTQAFENFTSLAMLEAMSSGNAIVAEDIGQTREFVRHGENGYLVEAATAGGYAGAIAEYIGHPERHDAMADASRAIVTNVHTIEHFAEDILTFWRDVLRS